MLFSASTRAEAWLAATEALCKQGPMLNFVLSIESPGAEGPLGNEVRRRLDALYAAEDSDPIHTIAETVFPAWEYRHRGLDGVFEQYPEEYALMKKADPARWGTYAHRLISRTKPNGTPTNPLATLIKKMREARSDGGTSYKSCYELGVVDVDLDLPVYDTIQDENRLRGLPCLSHLSFKLWHDAVCLTAIYRSHDYRNKVPGNLLGLARLQACVAQEVGVALGALVVHSTYAYVDGPKGPLLKAIAGLRDVEGNSETSEPVAALANRRRSISPP